MTRRNFLGFSAASTLITQNLFAKSNDIFVSQKDWATFVSVRDRIRRVKKYVGYGNFNIISFDKALFYGRNTSSIGAFSKEEIALLDKLFYEDTAQYGFYGKKITSGITHKIKKRDVKKVPKTGHYLFKGKPLEDYYKIKKDVGHDLILTSGIRSVVKQMSLYVDKIYSLNGNITQASSSIAPPAYTYHAIRDFDVGKKGFGHSNFTTKFTRTKEFKELKKLEYISMRYTINNKDGVRYEPWHIKVL